MVRVFGDVISTLLLLNKLPRYMHERLYIKVEISYIIDVACLLFFWCLITTYKYGECCQSLHNILLAILEIKESIGNGRWAVTFTLPGIQLFNSLTHNRLHILPQKIRKKHQKRLDGLRVFTYIYSMANGKRQKQEILK